VVVSAANGTNKIRVVNADARFPKTTFAFSPELDVPIGPWTNYPMTVARRLARNFGGDAKLQGVDIAFASDLPPASGMSSSSATLVASYFAIAMPNGLSDLPLHKKNIAAAEDLAMYLACNENGRSFRELEGDRGVGTFGGSEDHTAMLCCQPGQLSVYSFCPTRLERHVPFPDDLVFVVCHSGVFAEKTGEALAKYNSVSARARKACELYNAQHKTKHETIATVVRNDSSFHATFERIPDGNADPDRLLDRVRQFAIESEEIVPQAAEALAKNDLARFGELVDVSHANSRNLLWNIIPEIDYLQQSARKLGAIAASGFGAGFGGSAYAIVREADTLRFQREWEEAYLTKFPQHRGRAMWLTTRPAGAAHEIQ
jgi:galactokinase